MVTCFYCLLADAASEAPETSLREYDPSPPAPPRDETLRQCFQLCLNATEGHASMFDCAEYIVGRLCDEHLGFTLHALDAVCDVASRESLKRRRGNPSPKAKLRRTHLRPVSDED